MIRDGLNIQEGEIRSYLLIGQSNMAGRGDIGSVPPIQNKNCLMLRMGRWLKLSEPINPDRAIFEGKPRSGISLGASFADELAKATGGRIGLIPCADGGTKLSQWMPGEVLYDHAVMMAKLAQRTSRLSGILWHQGESDCYEERFPLYKERLIYMITKIRKELNAEKLPFILGELSENITTRWCPCEYPRRMNKLLKEIEKEIPYSRIVSAKDLTLMRDGLHFDSPSLRKFGNRYFEEYLKLVSAN